MKKLPVSAVTPVIIRLTPESAVEFGAWVV